MSKLFGPSTDEANDIQTEINAKMSRVLEDTILKNVQLQSDMEIMGNEIVRLEKELAANMNKNENVNAPVVNSSPE